MIKMIDTSYALLVEQKAPISTPQWDNIVKNLVMFSDKIWLHRAAVEFDSRLDTALMRHYEMVYNELVEADLIQFYSFESDSNEDCSNSSRIITKEEHVELYNTIIDKVSVPNQYSYDSLQDPERTSRIVERRNELWKYGLATLLDSEISVDCQLAKKIGSEISNRSLNSAMTNELFSAFDISSLTHLNTKDIIELRNKAQKHRKTIQDITIRARIDPNTTITDVVNNEYKDAIQKINELTADIAGVGAIKKLLLNSTINIVGLVPLSYVVLVPLTALICGKDLFDFLKSRKKYGFVLFMNSLRGKSLK